MTTQMDSVAAGAGGRATPVARYTYHLFSSRSEDDVVILLYDDRANVVGEVYFVADDLPLPPAAQVRGGGRVALYFPRASREAVVDMLRNEGPIELRWGGPSDTSLSTALELVGEGEAPPARRRDG